MRKILILNYPNLNMYTQEHLGGVHHLKANISGLKEYYRFILVLNSFHIRFFKKNENVIYLNIVPFISNKSQIIPNQNNEIKHSSILNNLFKKNIKFGINITFNFLVQLFSLFFNVSIYERANKILNLRSRFFDKRIIEINDEYFPKDLNFFKVALCVNSSHFKSQFNGLILEQPWPSTVEFHGFENTFKDFLSEVLIINTSPFGFDLDYFKMALLEKDCKINQIKYIGINKLVIHNINVINYGIISEQEMYFSIINSVDAVYISYSHTMSNERASMGFPMKIIDALSRGKIVYTNINFSFISKFGLEKWVRTNFNYSEPNKLEDLTFLSLFFKKYLEPKNYFKKIF